MASTSNILAVDFKRTEQVALTDRIREYIANSYAEHPDQYSDDLRVLEGLRLEATRIEVHPSSLNDLIRYYGQLVYIGSKFPLDIGLSFPWYSSFGKAKEPVTHKNFNYEKACILFNIGAMYSQLGEGENRTSADGLKKACLHFQNAAGCFKHLQDSVIGDLRCQPSLDLSPATLNTLVNLMLAQAQECFWQKAVIDNMKDGVIAKLAGKVADFYDAAYDAATNTACAGLFSQSWLAQMHVKGLHFNAAAQFRKSMECLSQSKYGEEIARLRIAATLVKGAFEQLKGQRLEAIANDLRSLHTAITNALSRAEKDNDLIYLELVPADSALAHIGRAEMVKPLPPPEITNLNPAELSSDIVGTPLFMKLVPFAIHKAASVYTNRKDKLVREEIIGKFEELNQICQSALQSLSLPATLQAIEEPLGLPPSLISKADSVRFEGGVSMLKQTVESLDDLHERDLRILKEALTALSEEAAEDEQHRIRFQDKWTRPPSSILTKSLVEQGAKHMANLEAAKKSDAIVKKKLAEYSPAIEVLGGSRKDLEAAVPQSLNVLPEQHESVAKLRQLMDETDRMRRQRKDRIEEARKISEADDIGPALLAAASVMSSKTPGGIVRIDESQFEELFAENLQKYDELRRQVREDSETQEKLLGVITEVNKNFVASRRNSPGAHDRDKAIQNLNHAYDKFREVSANLQEGQKFYLQFEDVLSEFGSNCKDYCYARKMESNDYLSDLMARVTGMNIADRAGANASAEAQGPKPPLPPRQYGYGPWNVTVAQQQQPPPGGVWRPEAGLNYARNLPSSYSHNDGARGQEQGVPAEHDSSPYQYPPAPRPQQALQQQQQQQQQHGAWNPSIPLNYSGGRL